MLVIRPTISLAKRSGIAFDSQPAKSSNRLGDWYANDIVISRKQFVLCMSEKGRLPVLLPAAPYATFASRLPSATSVVLQAIGIPTTDIDNEVQLMQEFGFDKTANRSVLGSMKEQTFMLEDQVERRQFSPDAVTEMSLFLAETISLILPERTPRESVRAIFKSSLRPPLRVIK